MAPVICPQPKFELAFLFVERKEANLDVACATLYVRFGLHLYQPIVSQYNICACDASIGRVCVRSVKNNIDAVEIPEPFFNSN